MKHYVISIGTLALLLLPRSAQASPSELCDILENVRPVSGHYVQQVLDRADRGIEFALEADANPDFLDYLDSWTSSISTSFNKLLDVDARITAEQNSLSNQSACLRVDLVLIECKMNKVMTELNTQLERGSFMSIMRLQELLNFLDERYKHVLQGALDPSYADPTWGNHYEFDPPENVFCCSNADGQNACNQTTWESCTEEGGQSFLTAGQCTTACRTADIISDQDAMCPYTSDYGSAFLNGFGCDIETMAARTQLPSVKAEYDALTDLQNSVNEFAEDTEDLQELEEALAAVFGKSYETTYSPPIERTHLRAYGCGWNGGYCTGNPEQSCIADMECANANAGTCEQPTNVCSENRIKQCFSNAECSGMGTCIQNTTGTPTTRSLGSPFSLDEDQISILSDFTGVRAAQELSRGFKQSLQIPSEIANDDLREERALEEENPFFQGSRAGDRQIRQEWSRLQATEESSLFPQVADAQLQIANALSPLRTAVSKLSQLSSEKEGIRTFLIRYAYYIRRTCMDRPCNAILDRILNVAFADECFPYANGEFLNDSDSAMTRWEICADEANISDL